MPRLAWIAPVLAAGLATLASLMLIRTGQWSVFDEYTHFDYVVRVAEDLDLPPINDTLGQTALQAAACERAPGFEALYARCGQEILPAEAPYAGLSTSTGYLPTYYVITGLLARGVFPVVEALAPDRTAEHNWLMAARAVGSLYLGLLAAVLVLMTRRLGADDRSAVALAVLAATSPLMLLQFSTVNNDALGVLLTAVAVLSWLLLEATRPWVRLIVSYGIALLAVSAKETALVALLCVMVLHASHLWHAGHRIRSLVAPLGAGIAVIGAYSVARGLWPALTGELPGNDLQADFITSIQGQPSWLDVTGSTLSSVVNGLSAPISPLAWGGFTSWSVLLAAAAFGGAVARSTTNRFSSDGTRSTWAIATSVAVYLVAFPTVFVTYLDTQGDVLYFQPRYLLPGMALAIGLIAVGTSRAASWLLLAIATAYYVVILVKLGGFA